jgi:NADPH-ferrihemoprotein reductase
MNILNKKIVIFWGSQSGTSEAFAHRIARELHSRYGQETLATDPSEFGPTTISLLGKSRLAIFLISTYGEREPSDNVVGIWN